MRTASEVEAAAGNPRVRPDLRAFMLAEIIILAPTGAAMFFATTFARSIWPWELTPFNARFIGGFYLAAAIAAAIVFVVGRWAPARVLTALAFIFTGLVLVVSIIHVGRFDFARPLTWLWFLLYALIPIYTGYALWVHRRFRADGEPLSGTLRLGLVIPGILLGAYGVGLLIAPVALAQFWPWPVDAFHGRLYAAVPMVPALTALLLVRRAPPGDLAGMGATLVVASAWIVLGFLMTAALTDSVPWGAVGTWVWLGGFVYIAVVGLTMIAESRRARPARAP